MTPIPAPTQNVTELLSLKTINICAKLQLDFFSTNQKSGKGSFSRDIYLWNVVRCTYPVLIDWFIHLSGATCLPFRAQPALQSVSNPHICLSAKQDVSYLGRSWELRLHLIPIQRRWNVLSE